MLSREDNASYSIKAVDNALAVLEAISEVDGEIRITRLSEKLGINKSNIHRLLATFERRGYVEKSEDPGKYRLGLSAYEMGQKFLSRMDLLTKAKPAMQRLARQFNEAVYLAIPRGREILMLDMINTSQAVGIVPLIGNSYPLSANAAGKAIHGRMACTDIGGFGKETASVAGPLINGESKVLGSICIAGPEFRMSRERMAGELLIGLKEACAEVSAKLGYFGKPAFC